MTDRASAGKILCNPGDGPRRWISYLGQRMIPVTAVCVLFLPPPVTYGGHETTDVRTINADRVKLLLDAGEELFIIDLRPAREFQKNRVPGARSIPITELQKRLGEIPRTGRVVFYLWMERNQILDQVSQLFEDNGYRNAAMMLEGFQEWIKRKYPVETGRKE